MKKRLLNRITALITSFSLCFPLMADCFGSAGKVNASDSVKGDVNGDEKINISDLIIMKSHLNGYTPDNFIMENADLDGDSSVTNADLCSMYCYLWGITDRFVCDMDLSTDTDKDGLCDDFESLFSTNPLKSDTDGDGLSDFCEILYSETDPLKKISSDDGIYDGKRDKDGDGLTNEEEVKAGTFVIFQDTDNDGLNDYEELKKYKTDPLKADTDGDRLSDFEEIRMGLNPLKSSSDSVVPDNERIITQVIGEDSEKLSYINGKNTRAYSFSAEIEASGYAEKNIQIEKSAYSEFLASDILCGDVIDISYSGGKAESLTVNFRLEKDAEKYCIVKYFPSSYMMLPVNTEHNGSTLSFTDNSFGTYGVVNLEEWVNRVVGDDEEYIDNSVSGNVGAAGDTAEGADIYFFKFFPDSNSFPVKQYFPTAECAPFVELDSGGYNYYEKRYHDSPSAILAGYMKNILSNEQKYNKDIRIYGMNEIGTIHIPYNKDETADPVKKYVDNSSSDTNIYKAARCSVQSISSELEKDGEYDPDKMYRLVRRQFSLAGALWGCVPINTSSYLDETFSVLLNTDKDRKKYCIILDDGSAPSCENAEDAVNELKDMGVEIMFFYYPGCPNAERYKELATNGEAYIWNEYTADDIIMSRVYGKSYKSECVNDVYGNKIRLSSKITNDDVIAYHKDPLSFKGDIITNADGDKLADIAETAFVSSISKLASKATLDVNWMRKKYDFLSETRYSIFINKSFIVWKSNPNKKDTDGDGRSDDVDPVPEEPFNNMFTLTNYINADPLNYLPFGCKESYMKNMNDFNTETDLQGFIGGNASNYLIYFLAGIGSELGLGYASSAMINYVKYPGDSFKDFYEFENFEDALSNSRVLRTVYYENMNLFMDCVENVLKEGSDEKIYLSSSTGENTIRGTDFTCGITSDPLNVSIDAFYFFNVLEFDLSVAIGSANNTIVSSVEYNKEEECYEADIKYAVIDSYDWDVASGVFTLANKAAFAKPFITYGKNNIHIKWEKGARYSGFYYDYPFYVNLNITDFTESGIDDNGHLKKHKRTIGLVDDSYSHFWKQYNHCIGNILILKDLFAELFSLFI